MTAALESFKVGRATMLASCADNDNLSLLYRAAKTGDRNPMSAKRRAERAAATEGVMPS